LGVAASSGSLSESLGGLACTGNGLTLPHLHRDWARPCHICTGRFQDWARPCHIHICTGLAPAAYAPGLHPLPHRHRDWALPLPHRHPDWAHQRMSRSAWRARSPQQAWARKLRRTILLPAPHCDGSTPRAALQHGVLWVLQYAWEPKTPAAAYGQRRPSGLQAVHVHADRQRYIACCIMALPPRTMAYACAQAQAPTPGRGAWQAPSTKSARV